VLLRYAGLYLIDYTLGGAVEDSFSLSTRASDITSGTRRIIPSSSFLKHTWQPRRDLKDMHAKKKLFNKDHVVMLGRKSKRLPIIQATWLII